MQAIQVTTLAPTEKKGLRFKATGLGMCAITANDYNLNNEANAAAAAQALLDNYNTQHAIKYKLLGVGTLPNGTWAALLDTIRR